MALDFSHLEASPAHTGHLDFSSLGAIPAVGGPEEETSALGAAGRGAVGMIPLGEQAYAGIESLVDKTPYIDERKELEKDIEADKANHPGARLAGQAAGVVAPALLTGGASLPGGALTEGAVMGAGFGTGKAIDTLAAGGSGKEALADVALGTAAGTAGGAAGKALGSVIEKVAKPFVNSQDEIMAEATAGILGGTTRQIRSLPGKNPVETLAKLGKDMSKYHVNGEPLIAVTDQMPARLNKFLALQDQSGKTIGDTIRTAGVKPMSITPIQEEMNSALKFATPDDQAQMNAVIAQVKQYANPDGTIPFERLQQLKSEIGDRAFEGEGSPALKSAYHTVSDIQDRELERVASTINKPEFDSAKNVYQLTSRAIPMLRMAVSKEIGGKANLLIPGAALLAGHPVVAAGALMKNRLSQMGSGAVFKGVQALPENAGEIAAALPGKAGAQIGGAAVQQNMGETHPVPGKSAPSPSKQAPSTLNIDHPAMAQWKAMFQQNAANAKNPGEVEKSHAVTDFVLSQRDPAYAAAKKKMSEEPMPPQAPAAPTPLKMAEGGVVPEDLLAANRERIEPGIMGETEPPEMKTLKALNDIGMGYGMGELGAGVLKKGYTVAKDLGEAGAIFPKVTNLINSAKKTYGITKAPEETGYVLPSGERLDFSGRMRAVGYEKGVPKAGEPDYLAGQRNIDHRDVASILKGEPKDPMEAFMKESKAIRYQPNSGIEVHHMPSDAQIKMAVEDFRTSGRPMLVDSNVSGTPIDSKVFDRPTFEAVKSHLLKRYSTKMSKGGIIHEPFNPDFGDKLKAALREKQDAKPR